MTQLRYYFFTWFEQEGGPGPTYGSQCLAFEGEFDLESAHQFIFDTYGKVGIITFWREVSYLNIVGFQRFVAKVSREKDPRRGLRVVK